MKYGAGATIAIATGLRNLTAGGVAGVERAMNEDCIKLAVTGLSRAGKTVFITSLIQNLLALGRGRDTMPLISARLTQNGVSRLRSVELLPAGAGVVPFFDHEAKLKGLAAERPAWPARTEDLAQISLILDIERPSSIGRRLGSRRVRLDILDYPGEWLLDLPMMSRTFREWSTETMKLLAQPPRRECSQAFLDFVTGLRPGDRAEESLIHRGHELYREALEACRTQHGLRYLQPGRFICPGPSSDAPFMWFFPMLDVPSVPKAGSTAALLQDRFVAYQQHMRANFFDTHFASFDRQIMLVDVLGALYTGRTAFDDTARVIHDLSAALRYGVYNAPRAVIAGIVRGSSHMLPSILGRATQGAAQKMAQHRIQRVVFVATKADHVPAMKRDNLLGLVRNLAEAGRPRHENAGVGVTHRVAASILSTRDGLSRAEGRAVEVVEGVVLGEDRARPFFIGDVPSAKPPDSFWTERMFHLPVFKPPRIDPDGMLGIPHLNLDQVLDDVIGDLL